MAAKAANPLDEFGWTAQTELRRNWEGFQWWVSRLLRSSTEEEGSQSWGWFVPLLLWTIRILGLVLLAVLLYLLVRQIGRWSLQWANRPRPVAAESLTQPLRSQQDWLAIAQEAQRRQAYREAFQALYMALLVHLHEADVLRQDAARTDREYMKGLEQLWSLNHQPLHLREDWMLLFKMHETLCFGGSEFPQELPKNRFEACQAAFNNLTAFLKVNQP